MWGDGHRAAIEGIGTYHLDLPSGLVIVLNNYHYAPSITRGVILVSHLFGDGFINHFDDNNDLLVSKNNLVYFKAVPRNGIFEIDMYSKGKVENQLEKTIKSLRSDRGGAYLKSTLPKSFWDYALESAARILNMVPTKKVDKTPYEIWHGQAPYAVLLKRYLRKPMGYSFYNPSENKVFVARNAEFFENDLIDLKASGSVEDLELIQEEDTNPSVDTSLDHEEDDQEIDEPQSDVQSILALQKEDLNGWCNIVFKARSYSKGLHSTYPGRWIIEETFSLLQTIRAIRISHSYSAFTMTNGYGNGCPRTHFLHGHLSKKSIMEQNT
ncbi:retrotransposon protein, putative, ty1-copia subclass [Tanacetum coccineum]